jgi:GH3 auxin-responsive promoter
MTRPTNIDLADVNKRNASDSSQCMIDATPVLQAYASHRARQWAARPAAAFQERLLVRLARAAVATKFGRQHDFESIGSVEDFQTRVPIRTYELFWEGFWRERFPRLRDVTWPGTIPFFAQTSGATAGATRFIPVTGAMNRANRKAALDVLCHHVLNRPHSRILGGTNFILDGGSTLVERLPGIQTGDLSEIAAATVPRWARAHCFPLQTLAAGSDREKKLASLARLSLRLDIRSVSGTPSLLLCFFHRALALLGGADRRLCAAYPHLELIVRGGVGFAPYESQFRDLLRGSHAETREVYLADEGFIAIADRGAGEGLRLNLDHGIFFEFVPVEELTADRPTRHWVNTIETGINYAIVVTTCAGLWAYLLGDTVRFIERRSPRLVVSGRATDMAMVGNSCGGIDRGGRRATG